jgi:hypothetical protein
VSLLLAAFASHVRLVVLNACFSASHAETIVEHVDFCVGMRAAVGDEAAICFAGAFYEALASGKSVRTSFELAKTALILQNIAEDETPHLFARQALGEQADAILGHGAPDGEPSPIGHHDVASGAGSNWVKGLEAGLLEYGRAASERVVSTIRSPIRHFGNSERVPLTPSLALAATIALVRVVLLPAVGYGFFAAFFWTRVASHTPQEHVETLVSLLKLSGTYFAVAVGVLFIAGSFSYLLARLFGGVADYGSHVCRYLDASAVEILATPLLVLAILCFGADRALHPYRLGGSTFSLVGAGFILLYVWSRAWYVFAAIVVSGSAGIVGSLRRAGFVALSVCTIAIFSFIEIAVILLFTLALVAGGD